MLMLKSRVDVLTALVSKLSIRRCSRLGFCVAVPASSVYVRQTPKNRFSSLPLRPVFLCPEFECRSKRVEIVFLSVDSTQTSLFPAATNYCHQALGMKYIAPPVFSTAEIFPTLNKNHLCLHPSYTSPNNEYLSPPHPKLRCWKCSNRACP